VLTCHAGATTTHCIVIDRDCSGCPEGACCTSRGRCAASRASRSQTAEQRCTSRGGTYAGNGTTCGDFDGDGIPDVLENNDCCGTRDDCHSGTNPLLADTDGDGADDGLELKAGTNPCDSGSVP
jgi:hypothetical protein